MAKNLIAGTTTTIVENGNDISVDLNTDYKDTVDSVGYAPNLETTVKTDLVSAINEVLNAENKSGIASKRGLVRGACLIDNDYQRTNSHKSFKSNLL